MEPKGCKSCLAWALGVGGLLAVSILAYVLATPRVYPPYDRCQGNLTQIMRAIITYQEPNKDNIPPSLADLVPDYLDPDSKVLVCPSDGAPMKIKKGIKCSYRYIGNIPYRDVSPYQIIAYDHVAAHHGGRNVAFFDGHVKFYREEEFKKLLGEQYEKFKPLMAKPDFPGDRDRVKAFFEDKDFPEK